MILSYVGIAQISTSHEKGAREPEPTEIEQEEETMSEITLPSGLNTKR